MSLRTYHRSRARAISLLEHKLYYSKGGVPGLPDDDANDFIGVSNVDPATSIVKSADTVNLDTVMLYFVFFSPKFPLVIRF